MIGAKRIYVNVNKAKKPTDAPVGFAKAAYIHLICKCYSAVLLSLKEALVHHFSLLCRKAYL